MHESPARLVLLGHPLAHSLSPVFQNAALTAAGIPLKYEPLDIPRSVLEETIAALRRQRAAGNVTVPHKVAFAHACDRLSDTAKAVGAVNTFWTAVDGALIGDNTDVGGFDAAVDALLGSHRPGERVAILGAGGAAAAVLHAVERWHDASTTVYSRTQRRAEEMVERFTVKSTVVRDAERAVEHATLVVNATPVGLRDDTVPVSVHALPKDAAVLDLAYRLNETAFVKDARARGHRAQDGITMLVEQGALSFERWFSRAPDRDAMWNAIKALR